MPISRAFPLLFLLVAANGSSQAQDPAIDDPVRPAAGPPPAEASSAEVEDTLARPAGPLGLYSPDVLVDMPYVYPLLRMRLTPEMRREIP